MSLKKSVFKYWQQTVRVSLAEQNKLPRMDEIETELKRVVSADEVDMEKLAGLKSLIELFQAVEE